MLHSDEISEYLTAAIEEDEPAVFITALGHVISHKGVAAYLLINGINANYLKKHLIRGLLKIKNPTKPNKNNVISIT